MDREISEEEAWQTLTIDVDKVIASKSAKLHRRIPRFLINYLKKTIHQDDINEYIVRRRNCRGVAFADDIIRKFKAKMRIFGLDAIPADGRYIFVSNHPMGGLDGIAFISAVGRRFNRIKFPVNDILLHLKNFSDIFLPVNTVGKTKRNAANMLEEVFAGRDQVLLFPAGLCSRKQGKEIKDLEWKKAFINKAVEYRRDIVPVYITGKNSNFFYNLALFRKRIGLKFNIEMLYLPDEMYKQEGQHVDLIFGTPLPWQQFEGKNAREEAQKVKEIVYQLANRTLL